MNCSLSGAVTLITAAIALLIGAIATAALWPTAYPLFAAAAAVATVSFVLIPQIKQALLDYAACRGATKCSMRLAINNLGQAAAAISAVSFLLAGAMQIAALAFLFSGFLAWIGVAMEVAVYYLVKSGQFACAVTALILLGVLSNAWAYKSCADRGITGGGGGGVIR